MSHLDAMSRLAAQKARLREFQPDTPDTGVYDPMLSEFERGRTIGLRQARDEYRRGFTDALLIAFIFFALGAAIVATVTAVYA